MAQKKSGRDYDTVKLGYISDDEIANFLSQQDRVPKIDLANYVIDPAMIALASRDICERHRVIPVSRNGRSLIVAMADPTNLHAIDDLKFLTGYAIEPVIATEAAILEAIVRYYGA